MVSRYRILFLVQKIVLGYFGVKDVEALPIDSTTIVIDEQHPPDEIISLSDNEIKSVKDLLTSGAWIKVLKKGI